MAKTTQVEQRMMVSKETRDFIKADIKLRMKRGETFDVAFEKSMDAHDYNILEDAKYAMQTDPKVIKADLEHLDRMLDPSKRFGASKRKE